MNNQLKEWGGKFGNEYTNRNVVDWRARLLLLQEMLKTVRIRRVLEVGCNRGHNLVALLHLIGDDAEVVGLEPNPYARNIAKSAHPLVNVLAGNSYSLPFRDGAFDLAMTWGVLVHVPLSDLPLALDEIVRVSRRYILAVEYFAESETTIPYRGHDDLLWKRNFPQQYQKRFPSLRLLREGFWGEEHGEDRVNWWLLEKPAERGSPFTYG